MSHDRNCQLVSARGARTTDMWRYQLLQARKLLSSESEGLPVAVAPDGITYTGVDHARNPHPRDEVLRSMRHISLFRAKEGMDVRNQPVSQYAFHRRQILG